MATPDIKGAVASIWQLTIGGSARDIAQIDYVRINASGNEHRQTFSADDTQSVDDGIRQLHIDVLEFVGYGDKIEYSVSGPKHRTVVLADSETDKACHIYEFHLRNPRVV